MKSLITLTLLVCFSVVSFATPAKKKTIRKSDYQTNMAFDGTTLNGKLNEGSLRKIVVENDKSLEDLLGVRKKFDDRVQEESQRNASW